MKHYTIDLQHIKVYLLKNHFSNSKTYSFNITVLYYNLAKIPYYIAQLKFTNSISDTLCTRVTYDHNRKTLHLNPVLYAVPPL